MTKVVYVIFQQTVGMWQCHFGASARMGFEKTQKYKDNDYDMKMVCICSLQENFYDKITIDHKLD